MTLGAMFNVINDGQLVEIVDNNTGEVLFPEIEAVEFTEVTDYGDPAWELIVVDVNCYGNVLTICIDQEV